MFTASTLTGSKPEQYAQLLDQARALMHGEPDRIANAANLSALVFHALPSLNWVGFYFWDAELGTTCVGSIYHDKRCFPMGGYLLHTDLNCTHEVVLPFTTMESHYARVNQRIDGVVIYRNLELGAESNSPTYYSRVGTNGTTCAESDLESFSSTTQFPPRTVIREVPNTLFAPMDIAHD